jgi:hypothetical protein
MLGRNRGDDEIYRPYLFSDFFGEGSSRAEGASDEGCALNHCALGVEKPDLVIVKVVHGGPRNSYQQRRGRI